LESKWRDFDARLGAFNDKIEDQKKRLREEIDRRAKSLAVELEKMYDRWSEKKPKERNQLSYDEAMETSEVMREMKQHWTELEAKIDKLQNDARQFNMPPPQFQFYDMMKDELNRAQLTWGLFDEFCTEQEAFKKEEWLTFRKKGYYAF
jgi:predicted patatin/cPLA2 family phospholipase